MHPVFDKGYPLEFAAPQLTTLRAAPKHDDDNEHGTQDKYRPGQHVSSWSSVCNCSLSHYVDALTDLWSSVCNCSLSHCNGAVTDLWSSVCNCSLSHCNGAVTNLENEAIVIKVTS